MDGNTNTTSSSTFDISETGEPCLYMADVSGCHVLRAIENNYDQYEEWGIIKIPALESPNGQRRALPAVSRIHLNTPIRATRLIQREQVGGRLLDIGRTGVRGRGKEARLDDDDVEDENDNSDSSWKTTLGQYLNDEIDRTAQFGSRQHVVQPHAISSTILRDSRSLGAAFESDMIFGDGSTESYELWRDEDVEDVEDRLWGPQNLVAQDIQYGLDNDVVYGEADTLPDTEGFDDILTKMRTKHDHVWKGINTRYGYWGSLGSVSPWHREDLGFLSINVCYRGAPKVWYGIKRSQKGKFESCMRKLCKLTKELKKCSHPWLHKAYAMKAHELAKENIDVVKIIQRPGDIVVTFPHGYHQTLNVGFNYNEAVNFVVKQWRDAAAGFRGCTCLSTKDECVSYRRSPAYSSRVALQAVRIAMTNLMGVSFERPAVHARSSLPGAETLNDEEGDMVVET